MKFYLSIEPSGRKVLSSTQEEARSVNKRFDKIDIPTDQKGLQKLVQDSFDAIFQLNSRIRELEAQPAPASADPAPLATLAKPERQPVAGSEPTTITMMDIENFILNQASVAQCEGIFSRLGTRFAELVKEAYPCVRDRSPQEPTHDL